MILGWSARWESFAVIIDDGDVFFDVIRRAEQIGAYLKGTGNSILYLVQVHAGAGPQTWTADSLRRVMQNIMELTMGTKNNPDFFDCYDRALGDEPRFTLLARDPDFGRLVNEWADTRQRDIDCGDRPAEDRAQVVQARLLASKANEWRRRNLNAWRSEKQTQTTLLPEAPEPTGDVMRDYEASLTRHPIA